MHYALQKKLEYAEINVFQKSPNSFFFASRFHFGNARKASFEDPKTDEKVESSRYSSFFEGSIPAGKALLRVS